jgi:hypothetical protein
MKLIAVVGASGLWFLAGPAAAQAQPPAAPRAPLWQGLQQGMTFDEAAAAIRAIPGVASVKITLRKKQPNGLQIGYNGGGVEVGPLIATIEPTFVAGGLESVALTGDDCRAAAAVKLDKLNEGLVAKYGRGVPMRVVDDAGVTIDQRRSYSSDLTHVTVAYAAHNDARDALAAVGHSGASGAVAQIGDSIALLAAKQALAACQADRGERLRITVTYEPQSTFLAARKALQDQQRAEKDRAAKSL